MGFNNEDKKTSLSNIGEQNTMNHFLIAYVVYEECRNRYIGSYMYISWELDEIQNFAQFLEITGRVKLNSVLFYSV